MRKLLLAIIFIISPFASVNAGHNLSYVQRECIFQACVDFSNRSMIEYEKADECIDNITKYSTKEFIKDLMSGIRGGYNGQDVKTQMLEAMISILQSHLEKAVDEIPEIISHLHAAKVNQIKADALLRCLNFDEAPYFDIDNSIQIDNSNLTDLYDSVNPENSIEMFVNTNDGRKFTGEDLQKYVFRVARNTFISNRWIKDALIWLKRIKVDFNNKQLAIQYLETVLKTKGDTKKRMVLMALTYDLLEQHSDNSYTNTCLIEASRRIVIPYYGYDLFSYELKRLCSKLIPYPENHEIYRYKYYIMYPESCSGDSDMIII